MDLSIQVFDRYISMVYANDNSCLANTGFLCHTAACSVLLAAKLMDSGARQRINMVGTVRSVRLCFISACFRPDFSCLILKA